MEYTLEELEVNEKEEMVFLRKRFKIEDYVPQFANLLDVDF